MKRPLTFRPEVRDEIDVAYSWYEGQRAGLGEEFLEALSEHLDELKENPRLCAPLYRQVRAWPMKRFPYVVYYRIRRKEILILAVQHGGQDPERWRTRV